jgi:DNA invertase Pin-like site-specific DNA recombinase
MYILPDTHTCVKSDALYIVYCRVSKPDQAWKLPHQQDGVVSNLCWDNDWHTGLVLDTSRIVASYSEVHSGSTFDRPIFHRTIDHAKSIGAIVAGQDINRLIRHPDYHPRKMQRPLRTQLRELLSFGVAYALVYPFTLSPEELRATETKRGMTYSAKIAGRPPLDEKKRQEVLRLVTDYTDREVELLTGVAKSTIYELRTRAKKCPERVR